MSAARARLRALGRVAALVAVAVTLSGTSISDCPVESRTFDVESSCGPAGELRLDLGDERVPGCIGGACAGLVHVTGGPATGLPAIGALTPAGEEESGEVPTASPALASGAFVLAGPVTLAGTTPPVTVERSCRAAEQAPGVVAIACAGDAPEAACAGTLTLREPPAGAPP